MTDTKFSNSLKSRNASRSRGMEQVDHAGEHSNSAYGRFLLMVGTSTAIMFGLMYLNSYSMEHLYWSETRFYMTFVMGAVMAVVMLFFMWGMYKSKVTNVAILFGSAAVLAGALWLVRSQETVQDESWMSAMIPHHSVAILTSSRAEITDPRVKKLAEEIVVAQNREIAEMRYLLDDIAANGEAGANWPLGESEGPTPIESLTQAISTPMIAGIRPAPLTEGEIVRSLGSGPTCIFTRAVNADPVLATDGTGKGVAKVSDALVAFDADGSVADGGVLTADGGQLTLTTLDDSDATLLFELSVERPLTVGFTGYWNCAG